MNDALRNISRYIDYLFRTHRLYISLHASGDDQIIYSDELIKYNFHLNPYCQYIKNVCGTWDVCIQRQSKVIEKCTEGSFFGSCYTGACEFVYPIEGGGKIQGFICVGGYRAENSGSREKLSHYAEKYGLSKAKLEESRLAFLCPVIPEREWLDTLIAPLQAMLALAYEKQADATEYGDALIQNMIHYINQNHTSKLTMKSLSEHFHMSVSALSHRFRKSTGTSISDYVNSLRLKEAEWLLGSCEMSLSEISETLGFGSPNYFSTVFRKHYGVSPKEYRKNKDRTASRPVG